MAMTGLWVDFSGKLGQGGLQMQLQQCEQFDCHKQWSKYTVVLKND